MVSATKKLTVVLVILALAALALAVASKASATWSTTNPGINIWITPNWLDNGKENVYYGLKTWPVDAIQYGPANIQYFYLRVKSDNYPNGTNLKWKINGITSGPGPSSNWSTNGWIDWKLWNATTSTWESSGAADGIILSDVDNNESFIGRIGFDFHDTSVYNALSWFPGPVQVQLSLYNTDNSEVYWTPTLNWFVWDYALENTINRALADTYTCSSIATTNYGTSTTVTAHFDTYTNLIWLKFPLSMPANWGVQYVYLKYFVDSSSATEWAAKAVELLENTTWNECNITYNNSGGSDQTTIARSSTSFAKEVGWQSIDITDVIRPQITAGASLVTISMRFYGGIQQTMSIRTKEYGTDNSYAPQLILAGAPMTDKVSPTFVLNSVTSAGKSGNNYDVLLQGRVDTMGYDESANFTFYVIQPSSNPFAPFTLIGSYAYPTAMTMPGFFSMTTTGYQYVENQWYYAYLKCHGNNTQTTTQSDLVNFSIYDNEVHFGGTTGGKDPCTVSNVSVNNVTVGSATLNYSAYVGENNTLTLFFDRSTSATSDNDYTTVASYVYMSGSAYNYTGLGAATTYYVRVRGIDANGAVVWDGRWMQFMTKSTVTIGEPSSDITSWPGALAERFNMTLTGAGILLSAIFSLMFLFPILYLGGGSDNLFVLVMITLVVTFSITSYAFLWSPGWLPISMVIFFVFAGTLGKVFRG